MIRAHSIGTRKESAVNQDVTPAPIELTPAIVYRAVLDMTNKFLRSAQGWQIQDLKTMENPTLDQIVDKLRKLVKVMRDISDDTYEDQDMATNALQCLIVMEEIVLAVINDRQDDLPALMRKLEGHNGAPCH